MAGPNYRYDRYTNPYNPTFSQPGIPSVSNNWQPDPGDTGGAAPTGGGGDKGGGGGGYSPGTWGGVFNYNLPYLTPFAAPRFKAPGYGEAMNEPGYQFRLDAGRNALEKSAAARGVLRTGGTLKDLVNYNQNFAAQEYNNVYNRALQGFDRNYRAASDEYAPTMAVWREGAAAERERARATYDAEYNAWALGEHNKRQASYDPAPA